MTFFYDLNKKLQGVLDAPKSEHKRLDERDMGKHNNAVTGFKAVADKAAKEYGSKAAGERVAGAVKAKMAKAGKLEEADLDEGFVDTVKQGAQSALQAIGSTLGHGSDEDMIRDLQKKAGLPQTGKVAPQQPGQQPQGQQPVAEKTDPAAFAALAEPKDKITFADKIAGAKKEVDEMLGDVAAEAMKNALKGHQQVADEGNAFTGKLKATPKGGKFKMGSKEYTDNSDIDEGWDDMLKYAKDTREKTKKGEITHGHKHDIEDTGTGRRVTRRTDPNTGYSVGAEDDKPADGEKRGRGRPKKADKAPERVTAKAYKHKGGRKEKVKEGPDEGSDLVKLSKVIQSCTTPEQLKAAQRMAQSFLNKHRAGGFSNMGKDMSRLRDVEGTLKQKNRELQGGKLDEKAVSVAQQQAAGAALAAKRGEGKAKGPSKEMAKMSTKELKKFAGTKHKGLPKHKKEEEVEESGTVAGSVAPAAGSKSKAKGVVGKGIYDSINRELEAMISESMNVNVSMNMDEHGEPRKSITVSAEGEAAEQLAQLLNLAGMAGHEHEEVCPTCGSADCGCEEEMVDENAPDWPTDQETTGENDPEMHRWAGGLNGPKSTGQTVGAPFNRQDQRQGVMAEAQYKADLRKMMEAAGIQVTDEMLDEGWKEKLAAAGTAAAIGATGLGMMGGDNAPNQYGAEYGAAAGAGGVGGSSYSQLYRAQSQVDAKADAFAKASPQFKQQLQQLRQKVDAEYGNQPMLQMQKQLEGTKALLAQYQANEDINESATLDIGMKLYAELKAFKG